MSFRRALARAVLAEVVSATAADQADRLRSSARDDLPGLYQDSKLAIAKAADGISEDPQPIVELIEAFWDRSEWNSKKSRKP